LQNRCAPDGTLFAVPARGTMMGNRGGRLHRADGTLGAARWKSRAWICCRLEFRNRHRTVMGGSGYTEIFFLDEATALAAGHRPCYECRRADARAFAALWPGVEVSRSAAAMDRALHAERRAPAETAAYGTLPYGTIFRSEGAFHLRAGRALVWSFEGYVATRAFNPADLVTAITPPTIRAILAAGYRPALHPSAGSA
jgi:hypothetical protein